uniref:Uncharacterized protein n=1 Tax=Rhizophora mucronata TaxID=61149 RepID=A0A2P2MT79_RHIMU
MYSVDIFAHNHVSLTSRRPVFDINFLQDL